MIGFYLVISKIIDDGICGKQTSDIIRDKFEGVFQELDILDAVPFHYVPEHHGVFQG